MDGCRFHLCPPNDIFNIDKNILVLVLGLQCGHIPHKGPVISILFSAEDDSNQGGNIDFLSLWQFWRKIYKDAPHVIKPIIFRRHVELISWEPAVIPSSKYSCWRLRIEIQPRYTTAAGHTSTCIQYETCDKNLKYTDRKTGIIRRRILALHSTPCRLCEGLDDRGSFTNLD